MLVVLSRISPSITICNTFRNQVLRVKKKKKKKKKKKNNNNNNNNNNNANFVY